MSKLVYLSVVLLSIVWIDQTRGHGMMLEPPNRSSLWRYNKNAPINYNDNGNFCGGFNVQWGQFSGKCGVCGDRYDNPHPQNNENTGKYGRGIIANVYNSSDIIDVLIKLTANHLGSFHYSLCVLDDPSLPEPGEDCFKQLQLADGSLQYNVTRDDHFVQNRIKLPDGLKCEQCVLRWHYRAGNNWGWCGDGTGRLGCGPQETFRTCTDIKIV